jgi:3-deoxy-D-manno-octulosonic-acid transferase
MRLVYVVLSYLMVPILLGHLFWRGLSNRDYWARALERFGFGQSIGGQRGIWVHAVSVGEVQASESLVRALRATYPDLPLVLTTVTPTGSERARALFGDDIIHSYAPYDLAGSVRRFFNWARPALAIILETELWPNLYHECGKRKVPLVLASARISPKSVRHYRRLLGLFRETLSHGIVIAAQSEADADRFRLLGANPARTHVTGNIKFDFELPADVLEAGSEFRRLHAAQRPVWIAASTHHGEEELLLKVHRQVLESVPDALLVLVPRHPERFPSVAGLIEREGFETVLRSSRQACQDSTKVFLGDSMGELKTFYAASDIAFVGGSLVQIGGHNLLEPAALGLPVLTGPHNFNAEDIAELFVKNGAATIVNDGQELAGHIVRLFADPAERARLGQTGQSTVLKNRGALARLLALVRPLLGAGREP